MPLIAQAPVPSSAAASHWTTFVSFSVVHLLVLGACVALMVGACRLGWLWRAGPREAALRRRWGWAIVVAKVADTTYQMSPGRFTPGSSLPIQLCDLAAVAAAVAMLTQRREWRTLLYFWGIGLSTQALVTPTLEGGPASPSFWLFWTTHLMIVGSAVYDLVVLGYRPHWRDFALAWGVTVLWVLAVMAVNLPTGFNYGFLGREAPGRATLIDRLGPWPQRVFLVSGIVTGWYAVMTAAWYAAYRRLGREYPPPNRDEAAPARHEAPPLTP